MHSSWNVFVINYHNCSSVLSDFLTNLTRSTQRDVLLLGQRSFVQECYLPAMVAAVSSASSRSFSSCRFSSSLWCFLCSSSITFWWDSSMAAKPLSHVAYEIGKHGASVSSWAFWTRTKRLSLSWAGKTSGPYSMSQCRSSWSSYVSSK